MPVCGTAFFMGTIMKRIPSLPTITGPLTGKGNDIEIILRNLPSWFGIEQAIIEYKDNCSLLPTWFSTDGRKLTGFISIKNIFNLHMKYM